MILLEVRGPYDFKATVQPHRLGPLDPTVRTTPTSIVKAVHGPDGVVVVHGFHRLERAAIEVVLEGPGSAWMEPLLPAFFGLHDDVPFQPTDVHPLARQLAATGRGLRLARAPTLYDRHAGFVLQQRVTFTEAARVWRAIHLRHGAAAPGAAGEQGVRVPLSAPQWRQVSSAELQSLGVDQKRWVALQEAMRAARHVEAAAGDHERLREVLTAIHGTGVWTSECVLGFGAGDADAVQVGDVHLAPTVTKAFDGVPRQSDERMLALLEPYRGNRFRIIRWLLGARYG